MNPINNDYFFKSIISTMGHLSQPQVEGLNTLLQFMQDDPTLTDKRYMAYMLATVKHETAETYMPIAEYGKGHGRPYGVPDPVTRQVYYGRGYVQLTWKINAIKFSSLTGADLVNNPDLALQPEIAYIIMAIGMNSGEFTGRKLVDYINDQECDYLHARRIINGMDRAPMIAQYARNFSDAIQVIGGMNNV